MEQTHFWSRHEETTRSSSLQTAKQHDTLCRKYVVLGSSVVSGMFLVGSEQLRQIIEVLRQIVCSI